MLYGRGTVANGYVGPLGTPSNVTLAAVNASVAPAGVTSPALASTSWVVVAADAGDLLGTNGYSMHQGPATVAASVSVTTGQAIQVTVGTDVGGCLGYNLYVGSVQAGPFVYAGRTGFNVGYIKYQPASGPEVASGGADQSASSNNFDGILTNLAASASYVTRLNAPFSTTNPGVEYQTAFASIYEGFKGDPDEVMMNAFDRLALSNALLSGTSNSYRIYVPNDTGMGNVTVGAVVTNLYNEVTGKSVDIVVNPWLPQGNSVVRSITLPLPSSNVGDCFAWCGPQDYALLNWAPVQLTWDSSTILIGTLLSYAPQYHAVLQGIQSTNIGVQPSGPYGDA